MPGKIWTTAEKKVLRSLRAAGVTVRTIVDDPEILPGRTKDGITQLLRRKGWVDPEASERCRNAVELDREQQLAFTQFLRHFSDAPIEQLWKSWNDWAAERGWPEISTSMIDYWIGKLRLPHSRSEAWNSEWSERKRRKRRAKEFEDRKQMLAMEFDLELEAKKREARTFRRSHKKCPSQRCGSCGNLWPLADQFFGHLPYTFAFGGKHLTGFQTEFCQLCLLETARMLIVFRSFGQDVTEILETRKGFKRRGIDKAFAAMKQEAVAAARKLLKRRKKLERRTCIRCECTFPLDSTHFHENRGTEPDGQPTRRALCVFCDHDYNTAIDRLKRDGLSTAAVSAERDEYLYRAREILRKGRRTAARRRCSEMQSKARKKLRVQWCAKCAESWIADLRYAHEFWNVGSYVSWVTGRPRSYLSKTCIFCKSDAEAEARHSKHVSG